VIDHDKRVEEIRECLDRDEALLGGPYSVARDLLAAYDAKVQAIRNMIANVEAKECLDGSGMPEVAMRKLILSDLRELAKGVGDE